jgi:hypothetical protein
MLPLVVSVPSFGSYASCRSPRHRGGTSRRPRAIALLLLIAFRFNGAENLISVGTAER